MVISEVSHHILTPDLALGQPITKKKTRTLCIAILVGLLPLLRTICSTSSSVQSPLGGRTSNGWYSREMPTLPVLGEEEGEGEGREISRFLTCDELVVTC